MDHPRIPRWAGGEVWLPNREALIAALNIVFRKNFSNLEICLQSSWMELQCGRGQPHHGLPFICNQWEQSSAHVSAVLAYFKCNLDNILGIWLAHPDPAENAAQWAKFQTVINDHHGLEWEFTPLSKTDVVYMDMSLSIWEGKIHSKLYKKKLALHLYIPSHSVHPPGVNAYGANSVGFFHQLCTELADIQHEIDEFYEQLLAHGHQPSTLLPVFRKP